MHMNDVPSSLDTNHLTEMILFLNEMRQDDSVSTDRSSIDPRQSSIQDAKDEELFLWMNESNQELWQKHPSFYHALIAELRKRNFISSQQI